MNIVIIVLKTVHLEDSELGCEDASQACPLWSLLRPELGLNVLEFSCSRTGLEHALPAVGKRWTLES